MSFESRTAPTLKSSLPSAMTERPQWVVWRNEGEADAKPRKVPYQPRRPEQRMSSTDPEHWASYDQAESLWLQSTQFDGIGFVFSEDDPFCGIDLDDCVNPDTGEVEPWAEDIVQRMESYTELSVSGTGLHIIIEGKLPPGRKRKGKLEMYDCERYFTVSGVMQNRLPIVQRQDRLNQLHAERLGSEPDDPVGSGEDSLPEFSGAAPKMSDDELLVYLEKKAESGSSSVQKMMSVWEGDYHTHHHGDHSNTRMYLLGRLAFWVGSDAEQIHRLASQSPLIVDHGKDEGGRTKWERLGRGEVAKAIRYRAAEIAEKGEDGLSPEHGERKPERRGLRLLSLADLESQPPVSWLVEDYLPEQGLVMVYGEPATGKSFLALDMALSIAYGQPWQGRDTGEGAVLYLAGEGAAGMAQRTAAWRVHHDVSERDAPFFLIPESFGLQDASRLNDVRDAVASVEEKGKPVRLIVIDTLARYFDGNENAQEDAGAFIRACDSLREQTGGCVVIVHHSGKDKQRGARGSSALNAAIDTAVEVGRDSNRNMTLTVKKQKDAEQADVMTLMSHTVPYTGRDGVEGSSLVVERIDSMPTVSDRSLLTDKQKYLYDALDEHGLLSYSDWQKAVEKKSGGEITKDKFSSHKRKLEDKKLIEKRDDGSWQLIRRDEPNTGGAKPTPF